MKSKERDISVWLIPEPTQEAQLDKIIIDLAEKFSSHPFTPHITLYHPQTAIPIEEVTQVVESKVGGRGPVTLDFEEFRWAEVFTQTFYLRYRVNQELNKLYEALRAEFRDRIDYTLNPHLSLIYSHSMTKADKQRLAGSLEFPQQLTLGRVQIIVKEGTIIAKEEDVLGWKLHREFPL